MEIQPGALFDLPFVAGALRVSGWILAGAAGLTASLVAFCVACEYLTQQRPRHRDGHDNAESPLRVPAMR